MIKITFFIDNNEIYGYEINGHSESDVKGKDIVCSAVSSAAFMTANTITDILNIDVVDLTVSEGEMFLELKKEDAIKAKDILLGFKLHINELAKQYSEFITVTENKE